MEDARRLILVLTDGDYHIALDGKVSENWFIERAFSYCLVPTQTTCTCTTLDFAFGFCHSLYLQCNLR